MSKKESKADEKAAEAPAPLNAVDLQAAVLDLDEAGMAEFVTFALELKPFKDATEAAVKTATGTFEDLIKAAEVSAQQAQARIQELEARLTKASEEGPAQSSGPRYLSAS